MTSACRVEVPLRRKRLHLPHTIAAEEFKKRQNTKLYNKLVTKLFHYYNEMIKRIVQADHFTITFLKIVDYFCREVDVKWVDSEVVVVVREAVNYNMYSMMIKIWDTVGDALRCDASTHV
jgi:hypothetical protein